MSDQSKESHSFRTKFSRNKQTEIVRIHKVHIRLHHCNKEQLQNLRLRIRLTAEVWDQDVAQHVCRWSSCMHFRVPILYP